MINYWYDTYDVVDLITKKAEFCRKDLTIRILAVLLLFLSFFCFFYAGSEYGKSQIREEAEFAGVGQWVDVALDRKIFVFKKRF